MPCIEQILKQKQFANEKVKANINLLYTANWIYNKISAYLKPFNLTHEQFNVLRILRGKHPECMCQKDVLHRMIAPKSNVTLILNKLREKGWVEVNRSEVDSREYRIQISPSGLELLAQIDEQFNNRVDDFNQITEEEAAQLSTLLDKLRGD